MSNITRGPFGRTGDGRTNSCQCHGCCGREWEDFPDTIEFRISSIGLVTRPFDYRGTMYKEPKGLLRCSCTNLVGIIYYRSQLIKILDDTWPEDDSETCCVTISLQGSCSNGEAPTFDLPPGESFPPYDPPLAFGECGWVLGFTWTGGDPLGTAVDVTPNEQNDYPYQLQSCDPIELTGELGGSEFSPACILGNSIAPRFSYEVMEAGVAGGDPAEPCKFLCWATLSDTLYATLESSCSELDGQVVTLRFGNQSWTGDITVGRCERYIIIVSQHERRGSTETCPLVITVKTAGGPDCMIDLQNLGTAPAPPPWGGGGTIASACGCKCGDHTIDIDITE